jgi:hypothetical protein
MFASTKSSSAAVQPRARTDFAGPDLLVCTLEDIDTGEDVAAELFYLES